ncbi:MAG TPA: hypothetical protein VHO05_18770 [Hyphomicrobium sp.]|nr:hypothetical protein [Hyphomicrobium sp.]
MRVTTLLYFCFRSVGAGLAHAFLGACLINKFGSRWTYFLHDAKSTMKALQDALINRYPFCWCEVLRVLTKRSVNRDLANVVEMLPAVNDDA